MQNPGAASISEGSAPLLPKLAAHGQVQQRVNPQAGPRQHQLRSLARRGDTSLVGRLRNGPGTHSGDEDLALVRADGDGARVAGLPCIQALTKRRV